MSLFLQIKCMKMKSSRLLTALVLRDSDLHCIFVCMFSTYVIMYLYEFQENLQKKIVEIKNWFILIKQ